MRFALDHATRDYGMIGTWTVDRLPPAGVVAVNAGQFSGGAPWGWLVRDGVEEQQPGSGSLGMSFVVDRAGGVSLVTREELPSARSNAVHAFQSYPALLVGEGQLPWELQAPDRGVDLAHRDSRLALGLIDDGSVVIAITRFGAIGKSGETVPWGPTVPEMAAFMKALGCRRAMLLDGGRYLVTSLRRLEGSVPRSATHTFTTADGVHVWAARFGYLPPLLARRLGWADRRSTRAARG